MTKSTSKDEKPQFLNINLTMSAANTYTQTTMPLPISPVISGKAGYARVIEILKLFVFMLADTLVEDGSIQCQLTTASKSGYVAPNNCEQFVMQFGRDMQLVTSGAIAIETPFVIDLTDGSGNGILIASSNLYFAATSGGQAAALGVGVKILYRFVDVPLAEYIGVVQSQS